MWGLCVFSLPISFVMMWGLYVFSLSISFVMIERIYILCLIIIIKSEVWTITHCLWLGHEKMVCAICVSICLWWYQHQIQYNLAYIISDINKSPKSNLILVLPEIIFNSILIELGLRLVRSRDFMWLDKMSSILKTLEILLCYENHECHSVLSWSALPLFALPVSRAIIAISTNNHVTM